MERIKVLCRMLVMIACTVMACTFIPYFYPTSSLSTTAYQDMITQVQVVYDKLQIDETATELISEEEFKAGLKEEDLQADVLSTFQSSKNAILYSEDTMNEVAAQVVEIYKSQTVVAEDAVLHNAQSTIRMISGAVIVLAICVICLTNIILKRKKKPAA